VHQPLPAGDAVAIDMPMTADAVVIYLGIVLAGCAVVSIADSFPAPEIASRLYISAAKAIFIQVSRRCVGRAEDASQDGAAGS
jgi:acyl-coenzyme A synthetase/AMP-(fatty) acid ligase